MRALEIEKVNLTEKENNLLYSHNEIKTFNRGEIILAQGKIINGIYVVIKGEVTIIAKMLGEGSIALETLGPGNFLGEISFIEKIPCSTSVVANHRMECLFISRLYMDLLTTFYPETKYKIYFSISSQVCDRLRKVHDKIIQIISLTEMSGKSFFKEMMHSFAKPHQTTLKKMGLSKEKLYNLSSLSEFTTKEKIELFKHAELLETPKHCTLIHKGEKTPACYFVLYGAVQTSILHDNKIAKLSVIGPSTLFASISCINNISTFTITFTTREPAILFKFSEENLNYFQKNHPAIWYKLFDLICRSLVVLEKSMDKLDVRLHVEIYNR